MDDLDGNFQDHDHWNSYEGSKLSNCNNQHFGDLRESGWQVRVLHGGPGGWNCREVHVHFDSGVWLSCWVDRLLDNDENVYRDCTIVADCDDCECCDEN